MIIQIPSSDPEREERKRLLRVPTTRESFAPLTYAATTERV